MVICVVIYRPAVTSIEVKPCGNRPTVGKNDYAVVSPTYGCLAPFQVGVGAPGHKVRPLVLGQGAPLVCLVPAILNGVVPRPVGLGIVAGEVVSGIVARKIVGVVRAGAVEHISRGAAVPAAGAPPEEVYPVAVRGRDVLVVGSDIVVLVLGEAPRACRCLILQVATAEMHCLAGTDRECGEAGTVLVEAAGSRCRGVADSAAGHRAGTEGVERVGHRQNLLGAAEGVAAAPRRVYLSADKPSGTAPVDGSKRARHHGTLAKKDLKVRKYFP